ncbi:copper chaperone PCu(A)C [Streptomyces sp. NPDC059165]|uniref:copper chaperone PCu(A)C n=1 Tax=Streptomyces sp. NPDC059165 TaxID=3346751 RepID=UPI0036828D16
MRDTLLAGLAPVTACVVALAGLTTWTSFGAAGTPPRIRVEGARIFLPYADRTETAAFFRITNDGGSDDRLLSVTSPVTGTAMLSRHVSSGGGDGMRMVASARIPAETTLDMSPGGLDVMVTVPDGRLYRQVGESLPFTLRFRYGGAVDTAVMVVRPGT